VIPSRSRPALSLCLALSAVLAACDVTDLGSPTAPPFAEPTPVVTVYPLQTTVWYAGLVVALGTATAELDERGGTVTVDAVFQNPTADVVTFSSPIRLTAGGSAFDLTRESKLPDIPAGGGSTVSLTFAVAGRSSVDDAVIRIGRSEDHQALVPLQPGPVPTLTLEPQVLDVKGTVSAGDLRLALRSGTQRWDLPDWLEELPHAGEAVTLIYDVGYRGTFSGGAAFTGDNVLLRLPDGTTLSPRRDGRSQSVALIKPGAIVRGLMSRFEIPSGVPGTYALILVNGSVRTAIEFTLGG
jgi:hypothetical protein